MKSKNILITVVILLLIAVVVFKYAKTSTNETIKIEEAQNQSSPTFAWKYEKDDSLNLDGIPNTNILIETKYPNGEVQTKFVATSHSSCNDLPDADKDSVPGSTNMQCYGAGLGYRYKITKGEKSYFVKRKMFEEASPEYTPTPQEYEVVLELRLN